MDKMNVQVYSWNVIRFCFVLNQMSMLNITVCIHSPDIVFVGTDQIEEVPHNSLKISIKWLLQYYCINTSGSY